ncbi:hypothetical protein [Actinopolymorpha rutila]|uniref:Uncharacterized protein n=1 Tax=Actinopolymorpha rutila TaxID=446787 RepID=A0A852ZLR8_9ACTN|nr:hypothetical protein [Actinopolymorpha rutila]NYH90459.1 hypothetical protein [Actinopolymorpha rutila]
MRDHRLLLTVLVLPGLLAVLATAVVAATIYHPGRATTAALTADPCTGPAGADAVGVVGIADSDTGGRSGGWSCPAPEAAVNAKEALTLRHGPVMAALLTKYGDRYCLPVGCWTRLSQERAEGDFTVRYGIDDHGRRITLGTVTFFVEDWLQGPRIVSRRQDLTAGGRGIREVGIEGERLYLSGQCPRGCAVGHGTTYDYRVPVDRTRDGRFAWTGAAYQGEADVAYGTVIHEFTWRDAAGRPGRWFIWLKGVTVLREDAAIFFYASPDHLPSSPYQTSWRPD